jgi:hypothetical protein
VVDFPSEEITTPALGLALLEMQTFQGTMPACPARGLFKEHILLILDAVIFNIFYEMLISLSFGTASLAASHKNGMEMFFGLVIRKAIFRH